MPRLTLTPGSVQHKECDIVGYGGSVIHAVEFIRPNVCTKLMVSIQRPRSNFAKIPPSVSGLGKKKGLLQVLDF